MGADTAWWVLAPSAIGPADAAKGCPGLASVKWQVGQHMVQLFTGPVAG